MNRQSIIFFEEMKKKHKEIQILINKSYLWIYY